MPKNSLSFKMIPLVHYNNNNKIMDIVSLFKKGGYISFLTQENRCISKDVNLERVFFLLFYKCCTMEKSCLCSLFTADKEQGSPCSSTLQSGYSTVQIANFKRHTVKRAVHTADCVQGVFYLQPPYYQTADCRRIPPCLDYVNCNGLLPLLQCTLYTAANGHCTV